MKVREKNGQGVISQENKRRGEEQSSETDKETSVTLKKENGQKPIEGTGTDQERNLRWLIKR